MKRMIAVLSSLAILLALVGCGRPSMNDIIDNKSSVTGVIQEVSDTHILIYIETDGYPNGADCSVSLDVENKDGLYSPITIGDMVRFCTSSWKPSTPIALCAISVKR